MSPALFVLGFGGTGARCVESLLYLQAAGAMGRPLQVLLVDPDTSNGNTAVTRDQLTRYHAIQNAVRPRREDPKAFLSSPINPEDPPHSVSWDYPTPPEPFRSILGHVGQPEGVRGLLELLYDRDDFDLSFEQGFVGRAHIGSVDVLRTLKDELARARNDDEGMDESGGLVGFFRRIRTAAQGDGARVVVIGSLFGGTGASALPAIPPLVRDALADVSDGIALGSVQMAPYFSFPPGGELDPDSALHPLATQAALHHYAGSSEYDSIYFVGAPDRPQTSPANRRGGPNQRNAAHYAELVAALGARDFFERPKSSRAEVIAAGGEEADWSGFPSGDPSALRRALITFATGAYLHSQFLFEDLRKDRHRGHRWADEIALAGPPLGGGEEELKLLKEFMDRFLAWADQISRTTDRPIFDLERPWDASRLGRIGGDARESSDPYHEIFEAMNRAGEADQTTPVGRYLHMLTRASYDFCAAVYRSWWRESA